MSVIQAHLSTNLLSPGVLTKMKRLSSRPHAYALTSTVQVPSVTALHSSGVRVRLLVNYVCMNGNRVSTNRRLTLLVPDPDIYTDEGIVDMI